MSEKKSWWQRLLKWIGIVSEAANTVESIGKELKDSEKKKKQPGRNLKFLLWISLTSILLSASQSVADHAAPFMTLHGRAGNYADVNAGGDLEVAVQGGSITAIQGAPSTAASWNMTPVQGPVLLNSNTTGAANTAVITTLVATAGQRNVLRKVIAFCSAGTSTITVQDGATTIYTTPATAVGTAIFREDWGVALTGTTGNALTITLATCGVGNTGTLSVQADRF